MPPMKATGMNTATMVKVVAMTARPISSVPSRLAFTWSLPRWRWRTMFSRTTIASSISMPMASDRPIRVITLRVKPKRRMTVKAAITEMGRVRPVMTVERQEFRKMKTMSTVRMPPRTMVRFTSWMESRMKFESSRTICSDTPGGISVWSLPIAALMPSATATVLAPDCFTTSRARAGAVSRRARFLGCSTPSTTCAIWSTKIVVWPARLTGMRPISEAPLPRAATRTRASVAPRSAEPAGKSTFSLRSASTTWARDTW
jgi:hypothetical protein